MYFVKYLTQITLCLTMAVLSARAQSLYKYQDEDGVWVYTDRQPAGVEEYEQDVLEATLEAAEVRLFQRAQQDVTIVPAGPFLPGLTPWHPSRTHPAPPVKSVDGSCFCPHFCFP